MPMKWKMVKPAGKPAAEKKSEKSQTPAKPKVDLSNLSHVDQLAARLFARKDGKHIEKGDTQ